MPATNRFYFPPPTDDREEFFGQLKFGPVWQGLPTQADLELLNTRFYPPDQYVPFEELSDPVSVPIEDLEYRGEQPRDQALATRERFFKSKRQFAEVRELIRLLDRYGYQSTIPQPLERLDPDTGGDLIALAAGECESRLGCGGCTHRRVDSRARR